jgi:hypothetical protein
MFEKATFLGGFFFKFKIFYLNLKKDNFFIKLR